MWVGWIVVGVVIGVIVMLPVVHALRRRSQLEVRRSERRARDAERLAVLGRMTSGLAHEIKNPLSTIGLNAQLLAESIADSELPEDDRERLLRRLDVLQREITRLGGILTDFLQFAGRMKLSRSSVNLSEMVHDLVDFFDPQCRQQGVVLRSQVTPQPVVLEIDETLVKQAVLNLMLNAVQAMASGESDERDLMLRLEGDDAHVRLHVIDTGPGIDPSGIDEIFHPYVSGKRGGTGLGLPTARRIVEMHGGSLEVRSEPGRGSDFVMRLPYETTERAYQDEAESS